MNRREFLKRSAFAGATAGITSASSLSRVPPSDRVTVGVLGVGGHGMDLMQTAMTVPGVEVAGICDAYTGRTERARTETGGRAKIYEDYREILTDRGIDTVIVATPDHWHAPMTVEALEAGKDVYVEKPMTYAVDEGLKIVEAMEHTGRIVQVGSEGTSSVVQGKAREIVASGKLGQVTMIRVSVNRNTPGGAWFYPIPPDASPKTVNWEQFLGPAPRRSFDVARFFRWRSYWDYSGGISTDLFVHYFTFIHDIMNAKAPQSVTATRERYRWDHLEVPDTLNGIAVYPEGFTVMLTGTFNNQRGSESGLEILGTEGGLALRGSRLHFTAENLSDSNRWVVETWPKELETAYYEKPSVRARELPDTWEPQLRPDTEEWSAWGKDSMFTHLSEFFDCVRSRKQPSQGPLIGHRAASAAHMINISSRKMKTVYWDSSQERVKSV